MAVLKPLTDLRAAVRVPQAMEKFKDAMEGQGFALMGCDAFVPGQRVCIFNRGTDGTSPKSNFFVLTSLDESNRIRLQYTNPLSPENGGMALRKDEVLIRRDYKYGSSEKWIEQTVAEIAAAAKNKPEGIFFGDMHGHFGYFGDELLMDMGIDDGRSRAPDIVMNMALWHIDFDATGHHNHYFAPLFYEIQGMESALGITKVPAFEITMPLWLYDNDAVDRFIADLRGKLGVEKITMPRKADGTYFPELVERLVAAYKGRIEEYNSSPENALTQMGYPLPNLNGPHVMVYCADAGVAQEIQDKWLSRRFAVYPPLAPKVELERFLLELRQTYGQRIGVMFAHPACSLHLPRVGILNRVESGDISIGEAMRIIKEYSQGVAVFNPTVSNTEELAFGPSSDVAPEKRKQILLARDYLKGLLAKSKIPPGSKFTENALNIAFALHMSEKYRTFCGVDTDCHYYEPVRIGKTSLIGLLGAGVTRIRGPIIKNSESFVLALHEAKQGVRMIEPSLFYELNREGVPAVAAERNERSVWEQLKAAWNEFKVYGLHGAWPLLRDVYTSVRENKPSLQELWHTLTHVAH